MRVDASQVLAQGGVSAKQLGTGALLETIDDGDEELAKAQGEEEDFSAVRPSLTRGFSDKSLAPFAAKLAELKMPVSETSARTMRELMAQYPKLSMDEAAFLASNKITGDESLMRAALDVLSGGSKTSAMIAQILSALDGQALAENQQSGNNVHGNVLSGKIVPESFHVDGSGTAPLTELIAAVVKTVAAVPVPGEGSQTGSAGTATADTQAPQIIITQPDSNLQLNAEKIIENLPKIANNEVAGHGTVPQESPEAVATTGYAPAREAVPGDSVSITEKIILPEPGADKGGIQTPGAPAGETGSTNAIAPATAARESQVPATPVPADGAAVQKGAAAAQPKEALAGRAEVNSAGVPAQKTDGPPPGAAQSESRAVQNAVVQLLSEIPQFQGTPPSALNRFSDMLLRIAKDTGIGVGGSPQVKDVELLTTQLEKMFTMIGSKDADAGVRLRQAREELFARLTLVQEEMSRASQPIREQLLSQTQKLMDHVKLLNNIEQFAYMQLPVNMRDVQKTAELYVFKRKGGKRADPDNVNILLSIDLEFMGHWEALLNIKGKDVYVNMEVAGEAQKEHFGNNTVLLHEMLAEAGFRLVNTNISISQEETTPLTALYAFDRYTTGGRPGKIDFFL